MSLKAIERSIPLGIRLCQPLFTQKTAPLHNTISLSQNTNEHKTTRWMQHNEKVYPPRTPDEEPRPAFVCNQRTNIKYSPFKMWYIASLIKGMPVDEAIKQLKFVTKKGAKDVREVIEEAKEMALNEHNVEFPSNMWVAESFVGKGKVVKGMRRHGRQRPAVINYVYCHYYVRLEEGAPPENYNPNTPKPPHEQLEDWVNQMRRRKITNSL